MSFPSDYLERVYAGVLGKIIGVYLGRPFEGWTYDEIMERLGEITYYVHEQRHVPLIVTDDDISGTFTFLRALPDYGNRLDLTPAQIGQTWLNYLIERRTILWWGGMGNSTEHTAYLRLKHGHGRAGERQPSPRTARWWPSRSAPRSSSTAGPWSRRATRSWPPTWRAAPPA